MTDGPVNTNSPWLIGMRLKIGFGWWSTLDATIHDLFKPFLHSRLRIIQFMNCCLLLCRFCLRLSIYWIQTSLKNLLLIALIFGSASCRATCFCLHCRKCSAFGVSSVTTSSSLSDFLVLRGRRGSRVLPPFTQF